MAICKSEPDHGGTLILDFWASRTVGDKFMWVKPPHLWCSVIVSPSWPRQWLKPDHHPLWVRDMQAKPRASLPFSPPGHRKLHHPPSDLQNALGCNEASFSVFRKQPKLQHQGVKPSRALSSVTWWQAANAATLLSSACMQSGSEMPASFSRSIHPKTLWQFSGNLVTWIWRWERHSIPHVAKTSHQWTLDELLSKVTCLLHTGCLGWGRGKQEVIVTWSIDHLWKP